ncbi:hypothetical protein KCP71_07075 [Salmonella enterica subsp. enterica]|nr:hypothetical protein KCP71_07075 [Salmonella enterica subsp. enterica]
MPLLNICCHQRNAKAAAKSGRRKAGGFRTISLSSIMVSADALATMLGNDTGKAIGTENGWIAIGEVPKLIQQ